MLEKAEEKAMVQFPGRFDEHPFRIRFHNGIVDTHQVLFAKGINHDLPVTRWC